MESCYSRKWLLRLSKASAIAKSEVHMQKKLERKSYGKTYNKQLLSHTAGNLHTIEQQTNAGKPQK